MKQRRPRAAKKRAAPDEPRQILKAPADPALLEQLRAHKVLPDPQTRELWRREIERSKQWAEKNAAEQRAAAEDRRVIDRALKEESRGYQTNRLIEALQRDRGGAPPKLPRRAEVEIRRRIAAGKVKIAADVARDYPDVMTPRAWQYHVRRLRDEMAKAKKPAS